MTPPLRPNARFHARPRRRGAPVRVLLRLAIAGGSMLGVPAAAQDRSPQNPPDPGDASGDAAGDAIGDAIGDAERVLPRVVRVEREVMPTRPPSAEPPAPGLTRGADWSDPDSAPAKLPEGSFLIDRPGRVVEAPGDRSVFVPDPDAREPGEGPMLMVPCSALERMEITLADSDMPVSASGQVFVFRERRYLMLTSFRVGARASNPEQPPAHESDAVPVHPDDGPDTGDAVPESVADDPEVAALLAELGDEHGHHAPPDAARGPVGAPMQDAFDSGAEPAAGILDGTPLVRQRGRLARSGDGVWLFVTDNDTDDRDASAMVVLPCLLLERIEREAMSRGDAAEMIVSGRVHAYRGSAYLLPTAMTRVRVGDIVPTN